MLGFKCSPDVGRSELPLLGDAESVGVDALGNVNALRQLVDVLQRPLDAVEDGAHDSGPELNRQRLSGPQDRVADSDTGSVLVHLEVGNLTVSLTQTSSSSDAFDSRKKGTTDC